MSSGAADSATSQGKNWTGASSEFELTNLPRSTTTERTASIGYRLSDASSSATVMCRLDTYTPIACPSTFELGKTNPLSIGEHTVDYYIDRGAGIDAARPDTSYSWSIAASTSTASTATSSSTATSTSDSSSSNTTTVAATTTSSTSTVPSGSALPTAPMPASLIVSGASGNWSGTTTVTDSSGNVLLTPVADPSGSGRSVNLHRILRNGASVWGGVRSEMAWRQESAKLYPGRDYWMAFATMFKPGEALPAATSDDSMLVFQTHTPASGDTQPDIALVFSAQTGIARWRVAYNTKPSNTWQYVGGSNPDTEGVSAVHTEAMPQPGVWWRYVIHYRPGYLAEHQPRFRVWRAKPGESFTQLFDHTGLNTYNSLDGPSYPRIGLYKWSSSAWFSSSIATYQTNLFFGQGTDLLGAAQTSLNGL